MDGQEVSNRVAQAFLDASEARGMDRRALVHGTGLDDPHLSNFGRHSWHDFVELLERIAATLGSAEKFGQMAGDVITGHPLMKQIGRLCVSPKQLYVIGSTRVARALYRDALVMSFVSLDERAIRVECVIPEPYRESLAVQYGSLATLRAYPRLIGLPDAAVDSRVSARRTLHLIHLPPSRTLHARLSRKLLALGEASEAPLEARLGSVVEALDLPGLLATSGRIGQRLVAQRTLEALADELARVLDEHFVCRHLVLWAGPPQAERELARITAASDGTLLQRPLQIEGGLVGRLEARLELAGTEAPPLLEGLLPWLAAAVAACSRAPVVPPAQARLATLVQRWRLTPRQAEVLQRLAEGRANKEIAGDLGASCRTVEVHVSEVLRKARAGSRAELAARFWAEREPAVGGAKGPSESRSTR